MATVLQILKWVGVLINIALVFFLVKLYYQHIHRTLWQPLRERCGEHSASSVSMLVLLVVLFVAGTVLQRGLMEWSSQAMVIAAAGQTSTWKRSVSVVSQPPTARSQISGSSVM